MWPFKKKGGKSKADVAIAEMPKAIEIASQKWIEFEQQEFAQNMDLSERVFHFTEGMKAGFGAWAAFKGAPDAFFMLIVVKGIERSRTHLRLELEQILGVPVPGPYERTDEEELTVLRRKLIDRCARKWAYFEDTLQFQSDVSLSRRIEIFKTPFLEGLRNDFPMFQDAKDEELDPIILLGIEQSGRVSIFELEEALRKKS